MKSDLIDIQVESRGNDVELSLSGSLGLPQLQAVKEKLDMLVEGPGCFYFLNLQNAHFTSDRYLEVFLELLNRVKAQKSALILIFESAELYDYFSKYLSIFEVYENRKAYKKTARLSTFLILMARQVRSDALRRQIRRETRVAKDRAAAERAASAGELALPPPVPSAAPRSAQPSLSLEATVAVPPPAPRPPVDPETAYRRARLGVVAAIALALLLAWIVQRRRT